MLWKHCIICQKSIKQKGRRYFSFSVKGALLAITSYLFKNSLYVLYFCDHPFTALMTANKSKIQMGGPFKENTYANLKKEVLVQPMYCVPFG